MMPGHSRPTFLLVALISTSQSPVAVHPFSATLPPTTHPSSFLRHSAPFRASAPPLRSGVGVADTYSWSEEQFEIEVKVAVPAGTTAADVAFKCSSESLDLRLSGAGTVLLDGARRTRGRICVDGTFWSLDGGDGPGGKEAEREITVTVEKHFVPVSTEGGVQTFGATTDFDWGGVYPDDAEEVSRREYDEAEDLNVREYAAKMGVDIDNIDMSKVNKTMFGTGMDRDGGGGEDAAETANGGFNLNITQATLEQLTKAGLAKEVVRQGDGMEYELGVDGRLDEPREFSMLGKDVSRDELLAAGLAGAGAGVPATFTEHTVPVEEAPGHPRTFDSGDSLPSEGIIEDEIVESEITPDTASAARDTDTAKQPPELMDGAKAASSDGKGDTKRDGRGSSSNEMDVDPIDRLTVVKLKQILKAQGLKVSGKKQVLRDRLRGHVNALLQEK